MVFPEDAFFTTEEYANEFLSDAAKIAKENDINILLPVLRIQQEGKNINTLNLINREGKLLNTYTKNHLVPVVEEPTTQKGDGKTPVIEIDGIKITYLICADFTSNQLAYNGTEADIFLNPSYDWEIFQYFTSYAVQARAIECGFATLRNPVNGNIILYDSNGRPMHMSNAMDVHEGILYMDVPCDGKQTIYDTIGNVFPWACVAYIVFAFISGFFVKSRKKKTAKS